MRKKILLSLMIATSSFATLNPTDAMMSNVGDVADTASIKLNEAKTEFIAGLNKVIESNDIRHKLLETQTSELSKLFTIHSEQQWKDILQVADTEEIKKISDVDNINILTSNGDKIITLLSKIELQSSSKALIQKFKDILENIRGIGGESGDDDQKKEALEEQELEEQELAEQQEREETIQSLMETPANDQDVQLAIANLFNCHNTLSDNNILHRSNLASIIRNDDSNKVGKITGLHNFSKNLENNYLTIEANDMLKILQKNSLFNQLNFSDYNLLNNDASKVPTIESIIDGSVFNKYGKSLLIFLEIINHIYKNAETLFVNTNTLLNDERAKATFAFNLASHLFSSSEDDKINDLFASEAIENLLEYIVKIPSNQSRLSLSESVLSVNEKELMYMYDWNQDRKDIDNISDITQNMDTPSSRGIKIASPSKLRQGKSFIRQGQTAFLEAAQYKPNLAQSINRNNNMTVSIADIAGAVPQGIIKDFNSQNADINEFDHTANESGFFISENNTQGAHSSTQTRINLHIVHFTHKLAENNEKNNEREKILYITTIPFVINNESINGNEEYRLKFDFTDNNQDSAIQHHYQEYDLVQKNNNIEMSFMDSGIKRNFQLNSIYKGTLSKDKDSDTNDSYLNTWIVDLNASMIGHKLDPELANKPYKIGCYSTKANRSMFPVLKEISSSNIIDVANEHKKIIDQENKKNNNAYQTIPMMKDDHSTSLNSLSEIAKILFKTGSNNQRGVKLGEIDKLDSSFAQQIKERFPNSQLTNDTTISMATLGSYNSFDDLPSQIKNIALNKRNYSIFVNELINEIKNSTIPSSMDDNSKKQIDALFSVILQNTTDTNQNILSFSESIRHAIQSDAEIKAGYKLFVNAAESILTGIQNARPSLSSDLLERIKQLKILELHLLLNQVMHQSEDLLVQHTVFGDKASASVESVSVFFCAVSEYAKYFSKKSDEEIKRFYNSLKKVDVSNGNAIKDLYLDSSDIQIKSDGLLLFGINPTTNKAHLGRVAHLGNLNSGAVDSAIEAELAPYAAGSQSGSRKNDHYAINSTEHSLPMMIHKAKMTDYTDNTTTNQKDKIQIISEAETHKENTTHVYTDIIKSVASESIAAAKQLKGMDSTSPDISQTLKSSESMKLAQQFFRASEIAGSFHSVDQLISMLAYKCAQHKDFITEGNLCAAGLANDQKQKRRIEFATQFATDFASGLVKTDIAKLGINTLDDALRFAALAISNLAETESDNLLKDVSGKFGDSSDQFTTDKFTGSIVYTNDDTAYTITDVIGQIFDNAKKIISADGNDLSIEAKSLYNDLASVYKETLEIEINDASKAKIYTTANKALSASQMKPEDDSESSWWESAVNLITGSAGSASDLDLATLLPHGANKNLYNDGTTDISASDQQIAQLSTGVFNAILQHYLKKAYANNTQFDYNQFIQPILENIKYDFSNTIDQSFISADSTVKFYDNAFTYPSSDAAQNIIKNNEITYSAAANMPEYMKECLNTVKKQINQFLNNNLVFYQEHALDIIDLNVNADSVTHILNNKLYKDFISHDSAVNQTNINDAFDNNTTGLPGSNNASNNDKYTLSALLFDNDSDEEMISSIYTNGTSQSGPSATFKMNDAAANNDALHKAIEQTEKYAAEEAEEAAENIINKEQQEESLKLEHYIAKSLFTGMTAYGDAEHTTQVEEAKAILLNEVNGAKDAAAFKGVIEHKKINVHKKNADHAIDIEFNGSAKMHLPVRDYEVHEIPTDPTADGVEGSYLHVVGGEASGHRNQIGKIYQTKTENFDITDINTEQEVKDEATKLLVMSLANPEKMKSVQLNSEDYTAQLNELSAKINALNTDIQDIREADEGTIKQHDTVVPMVKAYLELTDLKTEIETLFAQSKNAHYKLLFTNINSMINNLLDGKLIAADEGSLINPLDEKVAEDSKTAVIVANGGAMTAVKEAIAGARIKLPEEAANNEVANKAVGPSDNETVKLLDKDGNDYNVETIDNGGFNAIVKNMQSISKYANFMINAIKSSVVNDGGEIIINEDEANDTWGSQSFDDGTKVGEHGAFTLIPKYEINSMNAQIIASALNRFIFTSPINKNVNNSSENEATLIANLEQKMITVESIQSLDAISLNLLIQAYTTLVQAHASSAGANQVKTNIINAVNTVKVLFKKIGILCKNNTISNTMDMINENMLTDGQDDDIFKYDAVLREINITSERMLNDTNSVVPTLTVADMMKALVHTSLNSDTLVLNYDTTADMIAIDSTKDWFSADAEDNGANSLFAGTAEDKDKMSATEENTLLEADAAKAMYGFVGAGSLNEELGIKDDAGDMIGKTDKFLMYEAQTTHGGDGSYPTLKPNQSILKGKIYADEIVDTENTASNIDFMFKAMEFLKSNSENMTNKQYYELIGDLGDGENFYKQTYRVVSGNAEIGKQLLNIDVLKVIDLSASTAEDKIKQYQAKAAQVVQNAAIFNKLVTNFKMENDNDTNDNFIKVTYKFTDESMNILSLKGHDNIIKKTNDSTNRGILDQIKQLVLTDLLISRGLLLQGQELATLDVFLIKDNKIHYYLKDTNNQYYTGVLQKSILNRETLTELYAQHSQILQNINTRVSQTTNNDESTNDLLADVNHIKQKIQHILDLKPGVQYDNTKIQAELWNSIKSQSNSASAFARKELQAIYGLDIIKEFLTFLTSTQMNIDLATLDSDLLDNDANKNIIKAGLNDAWKSIIKECDQMKLALSTGQSSSSANNDQIISRVDTLLQLIFRPSAGASRSTASIVSDSVHQSDTITVQCTTSANPSAQKEIVFNILSLLENNIGYNLDDSLICISTSSNELQAVKKYTIDSNTVLKQDQNLLLETTQSTRKIQDLLQKRQSLSLINELINNKAQFVNQFADGLKSPTMLDKSEFAVNDTASGNVLGKMYMHELAYNEDNVDASGERVAINKQMDNATLKSAVTLLMQAHNNDKINLLAANNTTNQTNIRSINRLHQSSSVAANSSSNATSIIESIAESFQDAKDGDKFIHSASGKLTNDDILVNRSTNSNIALDISTIGKLLNNSDLMKNINNISQLKESLYAFYIMHTDANANSIISSGSINKDSYSALFLDPKSGLRIIFSLQELAEISMKYRDIKYNIDSQLLKRYNDFLLSIPFDSIDSVYVVIHDNMHISDANEVLSKLFVANKTSSDNQAQNSVQPKSKSAYSIGYDYYLNNQTTSATTIQDEIKANNAQEGRENYKNRIEQACMVWQRNHSIEDNKQILLHAIAKGSDVKQTLKFSISEISSGLPSQSFQLKNKYLQYHLEQDEALSERLNDDQKIAQVARYMQTVAISSAINTLRSNEYESQIIQHIHKTRDINKHTDIKKLLTALSKEYDNTKLYLSGDESTYAENVKDELNMRKLIINGLISQDENIILRSGLSKNIIYNSIVDLAKNKLLSKAIDFADFADFADETHILSLISNEWWKINDPKNKVETFKYFEKPVNKQYQLKTSTIEKLLKTIQLEISESDGTTDILFNIVDEQTDDRNILTSVNEVKKVIPALIEKIKTGTSTLQKKFIDRWEDDFVTFEENDNDEKKIALIVDKLINTIIQEDTFAFFGHDQKNNKKYLLNSIGAENMPKALSMLDALITGYNKQDLSQEFNTAVNDDLTQNSTINLLKILESKQIYNNQTLIKERDAFINSNHDTPVVNENSVKSFVDDIITNTNEQSDLFSQLAEEANDLNQMVDKNDDLDLNKIVEFFAQTEIKDLNNDQIVILNNHIKDLDDTHKEKFMTAISKDQSMHLLYGLNTNLNEEAGSAEVLLDDDAAAAAA